MKCPCCKNEIGDLPVEAIRYTMKGKTMIAIFDEIYKRKEAGVGLKSLTALVYPSRDYYEAYNVLKVTITRLKTRLNRLGWTIESSVSGTNTIERVYRFKRFTSLQQEPPLQ